MTTSTSKLAYDDCYEILDRALRAKTGIRIAVGAEEGVANLLCVRLHYARTLERQQNRDLFQRDDPQYGLSDYDILVVRRPRLEKGTWYIYVEKRIPPENIEELDANAAE
jgi:hypothetical protein